MPQYILLLQRSHMLRIFWNNELTMAKPRCQVKVFPAPVLSYVSSFELGVLLKGHVLWVSVQTQTLQRGTRWDLLQEVRF